MFRKKSNSSSGTNFLIIGIASTILLLTFTIGIISIIQHKTNVLFYNLQQNIQTEIKKYLNEGSKKDKYNFIIADSTFSDKETLKLFKKSELVFGELDFRLLEFCNQNSKKLPNSFLDGMPTSIVESVQTKNSNPHYVPILFDFYEIDINLPKFRNSGLENINFMEDLIYFGKNSQNSDSPFVFAGKEPQEFLNIFGMFLEAYSSKQNYDSACQKLYDAYKNGKSQEEKIDNLEKVLTNLCAENGEFAKTINILKNLYSQKLITEQVFTYDKNQLFLNLNNENSAATFLRLSNHRSISRDKILNFSSIYMPFVENSPNRYFCAPQIIVAKNKNRKKYDLLLEKLVVSNQTEFSTATGLAPVQRECVTADKQSSDVRYWISASKGPLMPLSCAIPHYDEQKFITDFLKNLISSN